MSRKIRHISKKPLGDVSPELEEIRSRVFIGKDEVSHPTGIDHPDAFIGLGIDQTFDMETFQKHFKIEIQEIDFEENSMVFDMSGVDTSLANAFRRILLSEV